MDFYKTIAHLETKVDYLETELTYLNQLLTQVGFAEGIETLKYTAIDLLNEQKDLNNFK